MLSPARKAGSDRRVAPQPTSLSEQALDGRDITSPAPGRPLAPEADQHRRPDTGTRARTPRHQRSPARPSSPAAWRAARPGTARSAPWCRRVRPPYLPRRAGTQARELDPTRHAPSSPLIDPCGRAQPFPRCVGAKGPVPSQHGHQHAAPPVNAQAAAISTSAGRGLVRYESGARR